LRHGDGERPGVVGGIEQGDLQRLVGRGDARGGCSIATVAVALPEKMLRRAKTARAAVSLRLPR
jgi:hypothetical protein